MTDAPFSLPPDYTLPTLEQRLDAAAEQYRNETYDPGAGDPDWPDLADDIKETYRNIVESVCRAFAPEHFKAPTKPTEATKEET